MNGPAHQKRRAFIIESTVNGQETLNYDGLFVLALACFCSTNPGRVKPMTYKIDTCQFLARCSALLR